MAKSFSSSCAGERESVCQRKREVRSRPLAESGSLIKRYVWCAGLEADSMGKIIVNKICCKKCGDIIESTHRYDFKFCKCGAVAVDGGKDYLRRCGRCEDWEELSECSER